MCLSLSTRHIIQQHVKPCQYIFTHTGAISS